jgi:hypothetical protein
MGLRNAIPDAITWFFEHVDSGIILEDDCLPSHAFFNFCSKLLDKYKDEERIAHINGSNFLLKKRFKIKGSYYFSNVFHPWGWATWKRAWNKFDPEMQGLDEFIAKDMLQPVTRKTLWRDTYYGLLTRTRRKEIDTWDYTWYYCLWKEQKLAITPALNLVSNIGFGSDATNTNYTYSRLSGMKAHNIYNMNDPPDYSINLDADEFALSVKFREGQGTFMDRLKEKIRLTLFR